MNIPIKKGFPLLMALVFLILALVGINLGEVADVAEKASSICLNCIGIG